jgi:hypothetical protein
MRKGRVKLLAVHPSHSVAFLYTLEADEPVPVHASAYGNSLVPSVVGVFAC